MAAFCGCCGAEITAKDEVCRICGTPRHGMLRADRMTPLDLGDEVTLADDASRTRCCHFGTSNEEL